MYSIKIEISTEHEKNNARERNAQNRCHLNGRKRLLDVFNSVNPFLAGLEAQPKTCVRLGA